MPAYAIAIMILKAAGSCCASSNETLGCLGTAVRNKLFSGALGLLSALRKGLESSAHVRYSWLTGNSALYLNTDHGLSGRDAQVSLSESDKLRMEQSSQPGTQWLGSSKSHL